MEEEADTPGRELRIAAVGPLTSFAIAGIFWGLHSALPSNVPVLAGAVTSYLAWINAALGVFNLLPGFPLDGGRVLRAAAWWKTGSLRRATRVAADAGKGLAIGLMLLGGIQIFAGALLGGLWLVFIGLFLRSMAEAGYQNLVLVQSLEDVRAGDVAIEDPVAVAPRVSIREFVEDYLLGYGYRAFPVVEEGKPIGLISVHDIQGLPADKRESTTVRERMRGLDRAACVSPDVPLTEALKKLENTSAGRLLVTRGDELLGILTKGGLARFVEIRRLLEQA
jgi:CBS domain-containing protein